MSRTSLLLVTATVVLIAGSTAVAASIGDANWFDVGQFVVLIATLTALVYQLWRERQEHGFEIYQRLMRWYTDHVWCFRLSSERSPSCSTSSVTARHPGGNSGASDLDRAPFPDGTVPPQPASDMM